MLYFNALKRDDPFSVWEVSHKKKSWLWAEDTIQALLLANVSPKGKNKEGSLALCNF